MAIGNDIVDISLNRHHHPRFEERAYTVFEREHISKSLTPEVDKWIAWAAKEAAYKLVKQLHPSVAFELKEFEWNIEESIVHYKGAKFRALIDDSPSLDCVHVVCVDHDHLDRIETKIGLVDDQDESVGVRKLAKELLLSSPHFARWCETLSVEPNDKVFSNIDFKKLNGKIPVAFLKDIEIPVNLSFSHDGAYVAVALQWKP